MKEADVRRIVREEIRREGRSSGDVWYHCTSKENARKILKNGWNGGRLPIEQFGEHHMKIMEFLRKNALRGNRERIRELENMMPEDLIGPEWRKFKNELMKEWRRHYSDRTYIWVSDVPLRTFGGTCLRVYIPDEAVQLFRGQREGFLFMVDRELSPDRFEKVENGEDNFAI